MDVAENDSKDEQDPGLWRGGAWKLYISRALTAWGDRLWSFGLGLLLFRIYPENLTLVAAYGLTKCFLSITLGAAIGNWIDGVKRLRAAQTFLVLQNLFVALDCCMFGAYFHWQQEIIENTGEWIKIIVAIVTSILALVAHLASTGSKIVVEKDWIVVIAGGSEDKLAKLNSIFRTIDLVCFNLTPILAGLLFSYSTYAIAATVIAAWNLISVIVEYSLLISIYKQFHGLAKKTIEASASGVLTKITGSYYGWSFYFRHKVRNAGLGLAFLYMTVLGFDNITWAYSLLQCVPEFILGVLVAISSVFGIAGSLVFPVLRKCLGNTERGGVLGMLCLVSSVSLCVVSIWLPGSPFNPVAIKDPISEKELTAPSHNETNFLDEKCSDEKVPDMTSVAVMLSGIIASRFGLWIADLSITQIIQENVEETKRGVFGGVQDSLNQSFNMIKFCLVLIMPKENMFGILIILSFIFISFGASSLTTYAVKEDKFSCLCLKAKYSPTRTEDHLDHPTA